MAIQKITVAFEVPEGYQARFNEKTKSFNIVKDRSYSWEEYCEKHKSKLRYRLNLYNQIEECNISSCGPGNICDTKKEVKAFTALQQLRTLRNEWVKESNFSKIYWYIINIYGETEEVDIDDSNYDNSVYRILSFPDNDMAIEFFNTFRDLFEKLKPLYEL